jgi:L-threonylcarbamoyladenylate synthase
MESIMNFDKDIMCCLDVLASGGLILYPTDTIWGIGCDATNAAAVEKIYRLKKRSDEKSLIVLVAAEKDILQYVSEPDLAIFDHLKSVTKPTTVVYKGAINVANNLIGQDGTLAIRICRDEFCKQLIKRFRKPIVSTSANISNEPFPKNFSDIVEQIRYGVDYIVHYRQNESTIAEPSALVRWEKGKAIIVRA